MKKLSLLLVILLTTICGYAAIIHGTVVDNNNIPVPNSIVYVDDSVAGVVNAIGFDTTDALGNYAVTIPPTVATGSTIIALTSGCGVMEYEYSVYNGTDILADFVVCSGAVTPDSVKGYVYINGPNPATFAPAYPAVVYLIERSYDSTMGDYKLTLIDSTFTDAQGWYGFEYMMSAGATALVKSALMPASAEYANYLPTYYGQSLTWDMAVTATAIYSNDIMLIAGTNPGGPGFIGGSVLQGANKTTAPGDPLDTRLLLLTTDADVPVAFAVSGSNGLFSFPNLAYGTYKLFGDMYGKQNPVLIVILDASNTTVDNVVFEENSSNFEGHIDVTGVSSVPQLSSVNVYPNPVADKLYISGFGNVDGVKTITLLGISGGIIHTTTTNGDELVLPVSNLASGTYIIRLQTNEGNAVYRVMK